MSSAGAEMPAMGSAELAHLLKTLGHPVRLRIVAGLAARGCSCVRDIWECLGMPQAVVSQHLKIMKEAGILDARRDGNRMCYSIMAGMMAELVHVLFGPEVLQVPGSVVLGEQGYASGVF